MNQESLYARKMARGTLLVYLYTLQDQGLNDPAKPRTATKFAIQGIAATGMLPPDDLLMNALHWLEEAGYITVAWAMDNKRDYESITITQKGINLYEDPDARTKEPAIYLQPRR